MADGYLDRLEVQNFKSYAGLSTIGPFSRNLTCVIGPNGSGKSNLMDAISFVVGVSTNVLRGVDLNDLRYRGTNSGDKIEGDGSTFVRLVRVDSDGSEEVFQRTIKKESAATEYRINKKVVTAKVYQDRLNEIGIHVKARNFLVFQNEVTAIASRSPKDLTQLIERVSGSEEFAEDYDTVLQEKEKSQEQLVLQHKRVNMFKQQKKAKKEQKKEAERFEELRGDLADQKMTSRLFELRVVDAEIEEVQAQILTAKSELDKIPKKELDREKGELIKKKASLEKEQVQSSRQIQQEEKKLEKMHEPRFKVQQSMKRLNETIKNLGEELARAKVSEGGKKEQTAASKAKLEEVQQQIEELDQSHQERANRAKSGDMKQYNALKMRVTDETFALNEELAGKRRHLQRLQEDRDSILNLIQSLRGQVERNKRVADDCEASLQSTTLSTKEAKDKKELETALRTARKEQRNEEDRFESLKVKFEQTRRVIDGLKATKNDIRREEKMADVVQQLKDRFPGVYGRVIDLFQPRKEEYQVAVSVALGRNMDAVVIAKGSTAYECVQYLKEHRIAPITFLPLDSLETKDISDVRHSIGSNSSVKFMIDVIEISTPEVKKAFQYALGSTVLILNEQEGASVCLNDRKRLKGVTLVGTLFAKTGLITGGAYSFKSRLEAQQITEHKRRHEELRKQLEAIDLIKLKRTTDNLANDLANLENDSRRREEFKTKYSDDLQRAKTSIADCTRNITEREKEVKKLEKEIEAKQAEISEQEEQASSISDRVFAPFCKALKIANISEFIQNDAQMQESIREREKLKQEATRLKALLARASRSAGEKSVQEIEETLAHDKAETEKKKQELASLEKEIRAVEANIKEFKEERQKKKDSVGDLERSLKDIDKKGKGVLEAVAKVEAKIAFSHSNMEKLKASKRRAFEECRLEGIDLPFLKDDDVEMEDADDDDEMDDRMDEEDGTENSQALKIRKKRGQQMKARLDYKKLPKEYRTATDALRQATVRQELATKITELQDEMNKMAPNMKAAEQLEEATRELAEATATFDQLKTQTKEISEKFSEIQDSRTTCFNRAFEDIARYTNIVYQELTREEGRSHMSGGKASLQCDNQKEPYLGGIKFDTIPPGKKFMDMEHLSGGEKSVAALALIFAIHHFRPSPFLVLDEVDAALDARNIEKVARYINSRHDNLQCIVISLKEKFYDKADSLIGICKEPTEAFSRTLSLNLSRFSA